MEVKRNFQERKEKFEESHAKLVASFRNWSYSRLIVTLIAIGFFVVFANLRLFWAMSAVGFLYPLLFGLIVNRHNKIRKQRETLKTLTKINEEELMRLDLKFSELDEGTDQISSEHPYTSDLDIFGRHSLFQLLNRTSTYLGRSLLADWLKLPASADQIKLRQDAATELSGRLDWSQEFQAAGNQEGVKYGNVSTLLSWIEEEEAKYLKMPSWLVWVGILGMISMLGLVITGILSFGWMLFPIIYNISILSRHFSRMKDLMEETFEGNKALVGIYQMIKLIEKEEFQSEQLKSIKQEIEQNGIGASELLKNLNKKLDVLNARANPFYFIINLVLIYDYFLHRSLHKWKVDHGSQVKRWFNLLAQMESLNSIGAYYHAHPEYIMPELASDEYQFESTDLGHPLILSEQRVTNDVTLTGKGKISIITGSNMSGKSTFLRTVGINLCLAQAGAPVCARQFRFSPTRVFTSMRNSDILEENISSFYAELKRLQALLNVIKTEGSPVMFMIDEVLKGTNSKDRHTGSVSLVKQLSKQNCFGWVSTHDLALGEMSSRVNNVQLNSFNSKIENDELYFDYKLSDGLCHSFNASILMRKMGIDIEEVEIE